MRSAEPQHDARDQECDANRDSVARQVGVAEQHKLPAEPRIEKQGPEQQRKRNEGDFEKAHGRLLFRCLSMDSPCGGVDTSTYHAATQ